MRKREKTGDEVHLTTIRLPEPWYEDLRRRSFEERRPMVELIKDALREKFGYPQESAAPPR